jgi:ureidoacrylate peracid hydrolase
MIAAASNHWPGGGREDFMHKVNIPQAYIDRVTARGGRAHSVESLNANKTALIVVDMQNYFMGEGQPSECPVAREIVPNVNRLADTLRRAGGLVVWIQTLAGRETLESWSTYYERMTPEKGEGRISGMSPGGSGYDLWPDLDVREADEVVIKNRYSAFIRGSSNLEEMLRRRGMDTILITGVSTSTCCESTARDGMMLNFRTMMISDGCAAPDDYLHNATLNNFYLQFGDVQSTDDVVALLDASAKAAAAE